MQDCLVPSSGVLVESAFMVKIRLTLQLANKVTTSSFKKPLKSSPVKDTRSMSRVDHWDTQKQWGFCAHKVWSKDRENNRFKEHEAGAVTEIKERATYSHCFALHRQKVSLHAEGWRKALYALLRSEASFWGALSLLPCTETNKTLFTSMWSHREVCAFPLSLLVCIKKNIALGVLWKQHHLK